MHNIEKTFSSVVCVSWDIPLGNKDRIAYPQTLSTSVNERRGTDHLKIALCSTNRFFKGNYALLIKGS